MKLVPVHSYGKCLHNMVTLDLTCLTKQDFPNDGVKAGKQKFNTIRKYKFTLVFENHSAKDYVSEKFFHAIAAGTVPGTVRWFQTNASVYMGAPNIDDFAPSPHSVIKADDFEYAFVADSVLIIVSSPTALAEFLKLLDNNETLYQEYLSWKIDGPQESFLNLISRQKLDARCRLCLKLAGKRSPVVSLTRNRGFERISTADMTKLATTLLQDLHQLKLPSTSNS
jgi:hypothetical protein